MAVASVESLNNLQVYTGVKFQHTKTSFASKYTLNGYIVEHSHSKGQIIMRRFDLEGLRQSQNSFFD